MSFSDDLSRVVSHALRHEPWVYELDLDHQGWIPVDSLVEALRLDPRWSSLTVADVEAMVAGAGKRRHEMREGRIRAIYGHSLAGRIARGPAEPPRWLFHGAPPSAAEMIRVDGLRPMGRQFVHLSIDQESARQVGLRKSPVPVILRVDTQAAGEAGVAFYAGNEKVWLADSVPPEFITGSTTG
ncbi:RNA 2'-phosphotransferase [Enemella evansiae]|uniref:RNA 2'-phosphotransferase n=1 Tax=Enemella evansiae TaxID=2016499 RepID=UPI000B95E86B|nr:RNA 2'-phosphotransferase [Enemella evansiae]OYO02453.1 RNA 2'-phosphotransferase [Enemella evansiae]OYO12196.1 RNA 2'-phosphotransferase [Enemella evansiae]